MSHSFNSNALGFGGIITAPSRALIPSVASAVLAPTGGFGSSTVTDFHYLDLISIGELRSEVYGVPTADNGFSARAHVRLTNVDVKGVFHADFLESTVESKREVDRSRMGEDPSRMISGITLSAKFDGVTVFGFSIEPQVDLGFFNTRPSYPQIEAMAHDIPEGLEPPVPTSVVLRQREDPELLRGSIVTGVSRPPFMQGSAVEIKIPAFGTIYLGEVLVKKARRRLNMLRIELNSKLLVDNPKGPGDGYDGSLTFCSADSNGSEIYP